MREPIHASPINQRSISAHDGGMVVLLRKKGLACRLDGGRDFKDPLLPQSKSEPAENYLVDGVSTANAHQETGPDS